MITVKDVIKGKCPNCKKADIFETKGNIILFRMPKMNERCEKCNFKFEKETGFFFGAMFVSYALAVAEMIASLIIFWVLIDLSPLIVFLIIAFVAFISSTFNFRVSRSIWIYLFY
ncbi:DUF983 domain-containing protein [uncultured Christiangramia sp.]|uniref:DUF983 domain-containing protein n=2 Tax=Christiangramia TaxID=292691 RepID=UPI0026095D27|nr:DUF983 domain-containing protein [uncultured Christiangramia sp.]